MLRKLLRRRRGPSATISAKVIRADGRVEDLGVVAKGKARLWKVQSGGGK